MGGAVGAVSICRCCIRDGRLCGGSGPGGAKPFPVDGDWPVPSAQGLALCNHGRLEHDAG
eukprot:1420852-Pyramimonas_sp.AAC.1